MPKVFGMKYVVACVPEFDDFGSPDLLAWDDAMDEHENDTEIWATFNDDEAAKLCAPILKELFESREENAKEKCDEPVFIAEEVRNAERKPFTLADWWDEYYDYWWEESEAHDELTDKDDDGAPLDWENIHEQRPSYHDFMTIMAHEAVRGVFDCNNNVDMSLQDKRDLHNERMNDLWELHDSLYETDIHFHDCVIGGIATYDVCSSAKIKVYGATRKECA